MRVPIVLNYVSFPVDATIKESGFGMPVRLNSPYAGAISHAISKIQESGFIAARRKYYWETVNDCKNLDVTHGSK